MLFRKDMEPNCAYCRYTECVDDTEWKCVKRGRAFPKRPCKSFRYDPLKRVPPRPASLRRKFRKEDFSL